MTVIAVFRSRSQSLDFAERLQGYGIAAETVADFGSQSLAAKITLAGKLSVFLLAMPIFKNLLTVITELL